MAEESSRQDSGFPKIKGYEIFEVFKEEATVIIYNARDLGNPDRIVQIKIPKIEGFTILEEIGKGGVATVFKACDANNQNRIVAIKVPLENVKQNKLENFFREADKVSLLGVHDSIVQIYDSKSEHEPPYIVMGWMEGGSLREKLDSRDEPFSFDEALPILQRIADAIDYTHEHGILHRDISPSNIMFDRRGKAYLGDFGCALLKEAEKGTKDLTQKPTGNPDYLAPEQVKNDPKEASDRYTLALVAYEMLTGRLAVTRWLDDNPVVLQTTEVRGRILRVLTRGFATDHEARFPTAMEFVEALKEAIRIEEEEDRKKKDKEANGHGETDTEDETQDLSAVKISPVSTSTDGEKGSDEQPEVGPEKEISKVKVGRRILSYFIALLAVVFLVVQLPQFLLATDAEPSEVVSSAPAKTTVSEFMLEDVAEPTEAGTNMPASILPAKFICEQTIAYAYKENGGDYDIHTFDIMTSTRTPITDVPGDDRSPAWSPGGDRLAYQSTRNGHDVIIIYTLETRKEDTLHGLPFGILESNAPAWSPDGTQIVFSAFVDFQLADAEGQWDLFLFDLQTRDATRLTMTDLVNENDPHWSWANNKIIYQSEFGGNVYLSVLDMGIEGSIPEAIDLGKENLQPGEPQWSPDGSKIAFSYLRPEGAKDIKIAALANNQWHLEANLELENYRKQSPAWAPNNIELLFVSDLNDHAENWDIYRYLVPENDESISITEGFSGTFSEPTWCLDGYGQ